MNNDIKKRTIDIRKRYNVKLGDAFIAATVAYASLPFITSDKGFSKIEDLDLVLYNVN